MCCFSLPVEKVANTKIFARSSAEGRQFLVYSMMLSAAEDLAMILPIPVPVNSKEDAVKFINLEKYEEFFSDMASGFPAPKSQSRGLGLVGAKSEKLEVVSVGAFEASFVPAIKDFSRLDERFRLPTSVWDKLPVYKAYGFTVFKLKKGQNHRVHPMAFEFPRANPKKLFFPTVHIHDGKIHKTAGFDHALFCQKKSESAARKLLSWRESTKPAGNFMNLEKSQGLIVKDQHCYLLTMRGNRKNEDILV